MPGIVFSEASGLNDTLFGKVQGPVQEIILSKAKSMEERSTAIDRLFKKTTSTHFGETYSELTSMDGFMPTPENGALNIAGMQEGFKKFLQNVNWTNSFRISRNMIDDTDVISLKDRPEAFIASYYTSRERFAAALVGGALSEKATVKVGKMVFDATAADGLSLFNAGHKSAVDAGYTQSNICSNTLSAANLGLVETAHQNLKDDNGMSLKICPTTIVIPNTAKAKADAFAAIGSDKDPTTSNNAFNYQVGRWNLLIWQELNDFVTTTSTTYPWFLIDEDYNKTFGSMILQERQALEVDSYEDKSSYANIWRGFSRFTGGFKDWRGVFAGGISSADALS